MVYATLRTRLLFGIRLMPDYRGASPWRYVGSSRCSVHRETNARFP
jgi:hypothetical protein